MIKYLFAKEILNNIDILKFIKEIFNRYSFILNKIDLNEKNNITLINNINDLLDLVNYHNFDINKLLYIILFYWYYENKSKRLPRIIGSCFYGGQTTYIEPIYLLYNYFFTYTNYTDITINEININYLKLVNKCSNLESIVKELVDENNKLVDKNNKLESIINELVDKNNKLESIVNELVDKNNKLDSIVKELVDKNNNVEELRNEINVYKIIVNNLITTNK